MDKKLFNDKVEGEIKSHEAEELKKAMARKLEKARNGTLLERMRFIFNHSTKASFSAKEMAEALQEKNLLGYADLIDIADLLNENFPKK